MRGSIRKEAALNKARDTRDAVKKRHRGRANTLNKEGTLSLKAFARTTEVSLTTYFRLSAAYKDREIEWAAVKALLNLQFNRAGRRSVLSQAEQKDVDSKMIEGGKTTFAYSV